MPHVIRLALVITELNVGGAETCLVNLATGIDRQRFEPVVYSLGPRPEASQDTLVRRLEAAGVETRFLDCRSKWQLLAAVAKLRRLLVLQQAEVVQSFLFHANVVAALVAKQAKVPQLSLGIRVADPSRWRQWLERWAARGANGIVCVSQAVADFCRQAGFPAEKLRIIPNGIDGSRFADARPIDLAALGIERGRRMLLFIGRLERQKGLDWLLPAMPELFRKLPEHDLVIVGEGPEGTRLEALAKGEPRIHFLGRRSDVPELLAAADLLVLPSRYEGMPNVLLEAMAAGKSVVSTEVEGVVELLGEGAPQQTAASSDLAGFLDKIVTIAGRPDWAQELGVANQKQVSRGFSLAAMVQAYETHFAQLTGASSQR